MTIEDNSTATKIKRLYHAEKWPIGTIAAHLCVHHSMVRRVVWKGRTAPLLSDAGMVVLRYPGRG